MQTTVQKKLLILLLLFIAFSFSVLLLLNSLTTEKTSQIRATFRQEKTALLNRIIVLKNSSLETFVQDYTFWDEMVDFIRSPQRRWADENIASGMSIFHAQAAWVYTPDYTLVYSSTSLAAADLQHLPIPTRRYQRLFADNKIAHFFITLPEGLLEIYGSTVHPTSDPERKTDPRGYFFVGRLWTSAYITDMGDLTRARITIMPADGSTTCTTASCNDQPSMVSFSQPLPGWDGASVGQLCVCADIPAIKTAHQSMRKGFQMTLFFAMMNLLIFAAAIFLWVSRPLHLLADSLRTQTVAPLHGLLKDGTEMGTIARLIQKFFDQKETLNREIIARRQAQEELLEAHAKLERRVQERTAALSAANATLEEEIRAHKATEQEKEKLHTWMVQCAKLAALGELSSTLAHEIKNPVGIITGYAGVILESLPESDPNFLPMKAIEKEARRCRDFLNNLLTYARTAKLDREALDLRTIIERVLPLIEVKAKFKYIQVVQELDDRLPPTLVNANNIQQMILNLCDNAIDAMNSKGTLTLRTQAARYNNRSYTELQIIDTGCGIPKDLQLKIFEPFFTTKPEGKGTGLGLSLVYDIVQRHEGIINLESAEGQGSTFRVLLPTAPAQQSVG